MNGLSNSRSSDTSGTHVGGVKEAGIDSARFLYRLHDRHQQIAAEALCGESPMDVGGLRAGYMEQHELLWVEGRPVQLLRGKGATSLLPPSALRDAHEAARQALREHGLGGARPVGVGRLDLTATVAMTSPAEGWATLRGMDLLDAPRRKSALYTKHGRPQTVYKLTERGQVRERIYDKGLEAGDAAPGLRIRFEAQTRYPKATRTTVEHWTMERIKESFESRFAPMGRAADGLHVASEGYVRERLRDAVLAGRISARQAELLLGHIGAQAVGIETPRRTYFRRRSELRRLGLALALDGDGEEPVDVDLPAILDEVLSCGAWSE